MFCQNCGNENEGDAEFCNYCGSKLTLPQTAGVNTDKATGALAHQGKITAPSPPQKDGGFFSLERKGVNMGVLGGCIMVVVAIVWFFGALAMGVVFFYPPVLGAIGVYAIFKGLATGNIRGNAQAPPPVNVPEPARTYTTPHPDVPYTVQPGVSYSGFWTRFGAYLIDSIVLFVVIFLLAMIFFFMSYSSSYGSYGGYSGSYYGGPSPAAWVMFYVLTFLIVFFYFTLQEAGSAQATLGKRAVKIKVVDSSGYRISFGQAALRNFLKVFPFVGLICMIVIGFTEKKQGIHDIAAKTFVVPR